MPVMAKQRVDFFISSKLTFSNDFINKTREVFEPLCHKKLSDEECIEIANNLLSLELYLEELKEKYEKD
jgi:hypothetical protein